MLELFHPKKFVLQKKNTAVVANLSMPSLRIEDVFGSESVLNLVITSANRVTTPYESLYGTYYRKDLKRSASVMEESHVSSDTDDDVHMKVTLKRVDLGDKTDNFDWLNDDKSEEDGTLDEAEEYKYEEDENEYEGDGTDNYQDDGVIA